MTKPINRFFENDREVQREADLQGRELWVYKGGVVAAANSDLARQLSAQGSTVVKRFPPLAKKYRA